MSVKNSQSLSPLRNNLPRRSHIDYYNVDCTVGLDIIGLLNYFDLLGEGSNEYIDNQTPEVVEGTIYDHPPESRSNDLERCLD